MRIVLQRVSNASVEVEAVKVGFIQLGLVVFLGIAKGDGQRDADYLAEKLVKLRVFPDENGKMNKSLEDVGGAALIISQFTLYGDCQRGRRPSFDQAAPPNDAVSLYNYFVNQVTSYGVPVQTGVFQAQMKVSLVNDGPVTLLLDSK